MKTSFKLIALLVAAGYPCVAFAEFLGASVPHVINAENALGLFSAALFALMMLGDYATPARKRVTARATARPSRKRHEHQHRLAA